MRGLKFIFALSGVCYLYFQEELLNKAITEIQGKYYHYRTLLQENQENFENQQKRKKLDNLFDPDLRIAHLSEKISRQLNALEPFEGDFLSIYVEDKLQQLKDNGAQTFIAQKGGGKTMEGLRIAKLWKEKEGPVLFFDNDDYAKNDHTQIFEKYGVQDFNQFKKVLKLDNIEEDKEFSILQYVTQLNKKIKLPIFASPHAQTNESKAPLNQEIEDKSKKSLLIVVDDADNLLFKDNKDLKNDFLLQIKELVKEGAAKVLFLCKNYETQSWLKEEFDSGLWKGIYGGSYDLKSKPVVEKYLNFVSELTGVRKNEAEKFFDFFGVDFSSVVELKNFMQQHRVNKTHGASHANIDDFIQMKIKESEQIIKNNDQAQSIMKVCKNIDKDWRTGKLTGEEKKNLEEILGPDGWTSLKFKAAAYSICGKPWKIGQVEKKLY